MAAQVRVVPLKGYAYFCDNCERRSQIFRSRDEAEALAVVHVNLVHSFCRGAA